MCGINGIAFSTRSGRQVSADVLTRMRDVLHHRGPDDDGIFVDKNIGLGHRRLSIVDVSHGMQPMHSGDCTIVFNGEVYNHADHREDLEAEGYIS